MRIISFCLLSICFSVSAFAQTSSETVTPPKVNINKQTNIYHNFALEQAKKAWGDSQEYTSNQQTIIKKIEELYRKLDAEYQADQIKTLQDSSEVLLQKDDYKQFSQQLDLLYQTSEGKLLPQKLKDFQLKKQVLLSKLPKIIASQQSLQSNIDAITQKDAP